MKVLLVATNRATSPYPVAPLGVLCVAGAARAKGHEVDFLDLGLLEEPDDALTAALSKKEYGAVALGIRNLDNCWSFAPHFFFNETRLVAETVRRNFKGPLILGGTGFSVSPEGWMRRLKADYGIMGEGENAFPELLSRLEAKQPPNGIEGLLTPDLGHAPSFHPPAKTIDKLNELPAPAHELCGYKNYLRRGGFVSIQTKRGCPFKCSYCIYPVLEGRRYRLRPPEAVVDEIEKLSRQANLRHFFFVDSVFNDPRRHALAICRELARRRLPVQWSAFCNPTGFDAELAHAMKEAGCYGVEFGLDVASDKMLYALQKPFGQKETGIALNAARHAGLPFAIYLLFGGPGETWADVEDTQSFLNECPPAKAVFATYGIRIYENTPLAKTAVYEGRIKPDHDLFEPAFYLSENMGEQTDVRLDRIARRRHEWSSPVDWRRLATRWGQKVTVFLNIRPQWKYMYGYGWLMRKRAK